ncbi:unnamed protein product [Fraxinus pennsylvanica]|uniref:Uncharacterized protein n=1 Tax=Fraxinus pennsylvanica TaxID=56036 RepID=A0AAD2E9E3_9LAMI|nr:unnamed protein product [Fraxinus pennsylvanica]
MNIGCSENPQQRRLRRCSLRSRRALEDVYGKAKPSSVGDVHRRSSLESRFCYDNPIPEEIIEKPIGLSLALKNNLSWRVRESLSKYAVLVAGELGILFVRDVGVEVTLVLLDKKVVWEVGILCVRDVG